MTDTDATSSKRPRTDATQPAEDAAQEPSSTDLPAFDLTGRAADTLTSLVDSVCAFGLEVKESSITPDFLALPPTGALAKVLGKVRRELLDGRGIAILRGVDWPEDAALRRLAFLALGVGLGCRPVLQSTDLRELVADVIPRDEGEPDRLYRGYRNANAQRLHCDANRPSTFGTGKCDILGMLCVRQSAEGGAGKLLSAEVVHRTVQAERPDVYARLCAAWPWDGERDWMEEWGPRQNLESGLPLFSVGSSNSRPLVQYGKILRQNVEAGFAARAAAGAGAAMTDADRTDLDFLEAVVNRERLFFRHRLQQGDVLLLNNYAWLHGRDEFPEKEEDGSRRHMLRLWLKS